jgi:hypothetical protein
VAEGAKVKTNVSIGRNSEEDQDNKLVTMMMICYTELFTFLNYTTVSKIKGLQDTQD